MPRSIHKPAYRRFCHLLVEARKDSAMTQEELAAKLDQPQSFVSKVETGERRLDVVEFLEIAEVLDLDIHPFLSNVQEVLSENENQI